LDFVPILCEQIQDRFKRYSRQPTENNRRQAYVPRGAQPLENPVGTAPAFYVEVNDQIVVSLPGVPGELTFLADQELVPLLRARMGPQSVILTRQVRTAGIGESWLDQLIQDLEQGDNPTVGLSAQPGRVDIRITAKAEQEVEAIEMLDGVESELRKRLGDHIYGRDEDTLESVIGSLLKSREADFQIWISGFEGQQRQLLLPLETLVGVAVHFEPTSKLDAFRPAIENATTEAESSIGLGLSIEFGPQNSQFSIGLSHAGRWVQKHRSFGGAPEYAHPYALSHALDLLRRYLLDNQERPAL
jgi:nicotinamide-nucleotide amidase